MSIASTALAPLNTTGKVPAGHGWQTSAPGMMYWPGRQALHCCASCENTPDEVPSVELTTRKPAGQRRRRYMPPALSHSPTEKLTESPPRMQLPPAGQLRHDGAGDGEPGAAARGLTL